MTTTAIETKTVRWPRARLTFHAGRLALRLVAIWYELWLPLTVAGTAAASTDTPPYRLLVAALLAALLYKIRAELVKNVSDTLAAVARYRWRAKELTNWVYPHLIALNVGPLLGPGAAVRMWHTHGIQTIPAKSVEAIVRPNPSQGDDLWAEKFGAFIARDLGATEVTHQPEPDDLNLLRFRLTSSTLPSAVTVE